MSFQLYIVFVFVSQHKFHELPLFIHYSWLHVKHFNFYVFFLFYEFIFIGRPDRPTNCSVQNHTVDILLLECLEGFDGGLPQMFNVEVHTVLTKKKVSSQSSK